MLQNKFLFNQSSVSLEIIGLPDYSNNENKDNISIISQWKLMIIDKPVIEGNIEHLKTIMRAFNSYSISLLSNEIALFESNLIDIKPENSHTHILLLKSSKPDVKPLNIRIGNSVLADIINCFDQLGSSNKVKNIYSKELKKLYEDSSNHIIQGFSHGVADIENMIMQCGWGRGNKDYGKFNLAASMHNRTVLFRETFLDVEIEKYITKIEKYNFTTINKELKKS